MDPEDAQPVIPKVIDNKNNPKIMDFLFIISSSFFL